MIIASEELKGCSAAFDCTHGYDGGLESFDDDRGPSTGGGIAASAQEPKCHAVTGVAQIGSPLMLCSRPSPSPSPSVKSTALTELFFLSEFERRNLVQDGGRSIFEVSGIQRNLQQIRGSWAGHGSPSQAAPAERACKSLGHDTASVKSLGDQCASVSLFVCLSVFHFCYFCRRCHCCRRRRRRLVTQRHQSNQCHLNGRHRHHSTASD